MSKYHVLRKHEAGYNTGNAVDLELKVGERVFVPQRIFRRGEMELNYGKKFPVEVLEVEHSGGAEIKHLRDTSMVKLTRNGAFVSESMDFREGQKRRLSKSYRHLFRG